MNLVSMFSFLLCKMMNLYIVSMSLPTPVSSRIVFVYINLQSHPLDWSRLLTVNSNLLYMFSWSPCSQICWVWIQLWGDGICLRKILILAPSHRRVHLPVKSAMLLSKSLQAINAGEGAEKREPSCTVGGNAN